MVDAVALDTLNYFGGLRNVERLDASYIDGWRGKLPETLIEFWTEMGIGSLADGSLWLCKPEEYSEVLAVLFGADPDFSHEDCYLVGYSGFGNLYIWSARFKAIVVDLKHLWLTCKYITSPEATVASPAHGFWSMISTASPDRIFDVADPKNKPLYKRAVKKLGPLQPGEIYGFVPALAFGGTPGLENLHRLSALEHFSILAQIDTPKLMDFKPWPPKFVRDIG